MKRKIAILLMMISMFVSIFSIWYFTPKRYSETVNGVYYQLGTEGIIERIKVHLDGKLQNHINGKKPLQALLILKEVRFLKFLKIEQN